MSTTSPDAKAVVRAFDALTTQARRIADALTTPVVRTEVAADDDATTPNDDGPRCVCGDPIERWTGPGEPGWIHRPGSDTPCTDARPAASMRVTQWIKSPATDSARAALEMLTKPYGCKEHPTAGSVGPYCLACTIVPPSADRLGPMDPVHILGVEAPTADEDAQRTVRRERLLNLLARLQRGGMTAEEKVALRQHVDAEMREADTARAEVQRLGLMVDEYGQGARHLSEELRKARRAADLLADSHRRAEEAQAAIERVRTLVAGIAHPTSAGIRDYDLGRQEMATAVVMALTEPEQPATEQPSTCTATIPDSLGSDALHRCVAPAGHYDETDEPVYTGPDRSPGGWHTDGEGHVWSDRAAAATPHGHQPTTEA